jgi:hypothetical protein
VTNPTAGIKGIAVILLTAAAGVARISLIKNGIFVIG